MSDDLSVIERAADGPARGAVIALHGRGTIGADLAPLADAMDLAGLLWFFPDAPFDFPGDFGGRMWYAPPPARDADIATSRAELFALLDRVRAERGLASDRIVLLGFSQGAVMSLEVGLRYPLPLAGIIALSGYLARAETVATERAPAAATVPVVMVHGKNDDVVPVDGSRTAEAQLRGLGQPVRLYEYLMGHEVIPEEIDLVRQQLRRMLNLETERRG